MALQVWLPLNKDFNNKGIDNSVSITTSNVSITNGGKLGGCVQVTGTSKRISLGAKPYMSPNGENEFSIAMWVKPTTFNYIIAFNSFEFRLTATLAQFRTGSGSGPYTISAEKSGTYDANKWYHMCGTWSAEKRRLRLYLNGELIAENNSTPGDYQAGHTKMDLVYGGDWNICDFRIYDNELSKVEVKEISRGLVLHYKLDDPYIEPTINLVSGLVSAGENNVAYSVATWATFVTSVTNKNGIYTFSAYITNTSDHALNCRLSCYNADGSSYNAIQGNSIPAGSEGLSVVTCDTSNTANFNGTIYLYIQNGNAGVDPTNKTFYLREVQFEEKDHATPFTKWSRSETFVPDSSGYGNNGTIDNGNLVTGINRGGQTTVENGVVTTSGVNADTYFNLLMSESLTQGVTYTISCIAENIPQNTNWRFPIGGQSNTSLIFEINKNGLNYYTFTMNDFDAGTNQCFMDDVNRTAYQNKCKFYNWRIERADKQILSTETVSPRYDHCFKWNGACDIQVKNPLYVTTTTEVQALTVALWYKPSSSNSGYHTLTSNSHPHSGFWLSTNCEGSPLWFYRGSLYIYGKNITISNNVWHHIVLTWDGTNYQFYLNGNPVTTTVYNSGNHTYIGPYFQEYLSVGGNRGTNTAGSSGDYRDYGSTSDYRLYATALSAEDVKQLYEVSAKIDKSGNLHSYEFNELHVGRELLTTTITTPYNNNTTPFAGFTSDGMHFEGNGSCGTNYIEINPSGKQYIYDYTISVSTGNQFYIGFERYDENKTARSNQACVYTFAQKPTSDIVKKRYTGVVNLATDGVNPCKYIRLRILNGWTGTDSSSTKLATIYNLSLREVPTSTTAKTKLYKTGIFESDLLLEGNEKAEIEKNLNIYANEFIEI